MLRVKRFTAEIKNLFSGVGLRPSSSDERIDSSMFALEVFVSYTFFFSIDSHDPLLAALG